MSATAQGRKATAVLRQRSPMVVSADDAVHLRIWSLVGILSILFSDKRPPPLPSLDELLRFELAADAVKSALGTMNEHTFVNIVLFEGKVEVLRVA